MRSMPWSWADYEDTPVAVREFCWTFLMMERRIRNSRAAQTARHEPGTVRVRR